MAESKFFKVGFRTFANGTSMHGFTELYYAKHVFWKIFWVIILMCGFGITIFQVYRASYQFAYQPTATSIDMLDTDDFILPPMKVCHVHWIYWIDWEKAYRMKFNKPSILYGMSFLTNVYSSTYFNVKEAKKNFGETMRKNNFTTLSQFYIAVAKSISLVGKDGYLLKEYKYFNDVDIVFKADNSLLCYSTSGEVVLDSVFFKYQSPLNNHWKGFVFNFSLQDITYDTLKDYLTLEEYSYYVAIWLKINSNYWITFDKTLMNYSTYTLPVYFFPDGTSENLVQIDHEKNDYKVNIGVSVSKWKRTRQMPCLEDQVATYGNYTFCLELCRARYMAKACKCPRFAQNAMIGKDYVDNLCSKRIFFLPLRTINTPDNVTNSNKLDDGTDDVTNFYTPSQFVCTTKDMELTKRYNDCLVSCDSPPCEVWTYAVSSTSSTMENFARKFLYKNQTDVNVEISSPFATYKMVEIDSVTIEGFIGNVGGLLGVWTGASVISFIQLVYLCCCANCTRSNRKKDMAVTLAADNVPKVSIVMQDSYA